MVKSIKRRALQLLHSTIARLWVRPLEERFIPFLEKKPGWLSKRLLGWASWWANAGRVIVNELRPLKKRWVGPDWSVTYLGNGKSAEILCCHLFPTPPEEVESTRVSLWQVPALIRKHTDEGDLVVCELNRIIRLSPEGMNFSFISPRLVNQVIIGLDRPLDEILATFQEHNRKRIRNLEAQGYSFEATHSEADFDLFYHRMYLPYTTGRHTGRSLDLYGYDFLFRYFKAGVLILVKLNGEPIAGGINRLFGDTCSGDQSGVLDGQFDLVKQGSNVALEWFTILWARQQGARCFDLGTSYSFTANGLFQFKRNWGTSVFRVNHNPDHWSFYAKNIPTQLREYLNQLGFITEAGGKHYQVMIHDQAEPVDEEKIAKQLYHLSKGSLDGMIMITSDGKKRLVPLEALKRGPNGQSYLVIPDLSAL